eukprot:TRINITY_DN9854_c0_g1_i1.p1 TRINITY_DN9854_c0_g1~~TRINITY_DN9854_c0_g1_i1.p1  ORF type:complete len:362 (+),score=18.64 TRINITY_DN9854_c0_g1_i1:423-1508(+)
MTNMLRQHSSRKACGLSFPAIIQNGNCQSTLTLLLATIVAVTNSQSPCPNNQHPVCENNTKPIKCEDGSTTIPCPSQVRPICEDGQYPQCPSLTTTASNIASTRSDPASATFAPPASITACPDTPPYHSVATTIMADGRVQIITSSCPPYIKGWNNPMEALGTRTNISIQKPVFAARPISVGKELEKYDGIMYLVDDGTAQAGRLGILKNGVEIFGRYSPCGYASKCKTQNGCPRVSQAPCEVDPDAPSNVVDAIDSEIETIDMCGGHPTPNGDYHIHTFHSGNRSICGDDRYLPHDTPGQHSHWVGCTTALASTDPTPKTGDRLFWMNARPHAHYRWKYDLPLSLYRYIPLDNWLLQRLS